MVLFLPLPTTTCAEQKYKDVAVDAATFEKMKKDGTLNFGVLPVLKHGSQIIEQRSVLACLTCHLQTSFTHLPPCSGNILEYVAEIADVRGLGVAGNKYLGLDTIERYHHRAHTAAVCLLMSHLHQFY